MFSLISRIIFWLAGWNIAGRWPDLTHYVVIGGPHTSAWDVVIAFLTKSITKLDARFLAKAELFRFPMGAYFRWMGAMPVKRTTKEDTVTYVTSLFESSPTFILGLAPEGTRSHAPQWRTGFWHIAMAANVPVVSATMDFKKKVVTIHPPYYLTGDIDKDIEFLSNHFKGVSGVYPELSTY